MLWNQFRFPGTSNAGHHQSTHKATVRAMEKLSQNKKKKAVVQLVIAEVYSSMLHDASWIQESSLFNRIPKERWQCSSTSDILAVHTPSFIAKWIGEDDLLPAWLPQASGKHGVGYAHYMCGRTLPYSWERFAVWMIPFQEFHTPFGRPKGNSFPGVGRVE